MRFKSFLAAIWQVLIDKLERPNDLGRNPDKYKQVELTSVPVELQKTFPET